MSAKFLLQAVFLLIAAQLVLGALGFITQSWPWLGLLLLPLLAWMIFRVGSVVRDEMKKAQKKGADLEPARLVLFIGVLWQLPALVLAPLWAPLWATELWQGAVLPFPGIFHLELGAWLWVACLAEVSFFAWASLRSEPKLQVQITRGEAFSKASGEWAVARRRDDVLAQRGKKAEE